MNEDIIAKAKKVKMLILDVDGVLTDSTINVCANGDEMKVFNVQDGFGLVMFKRCGYKTAIITARSAKAVEVRAEDLKIDKVFQDAHPKTEAYAQLLAEFNLTDDDVCFMGDDLPDLGVLGKVGFAVTVPNGVSEVKDVADYVTSNCGGKGAVREVIEFILKAKGEWLPLVQSFQS